MRYYIKLKFVKPNPSPIFLPHVDKNTFVVFLIKIRNILVNIPKKDIFIGKEVILEEKRQEGLDSQILSYLRFCKIYLICFLFNM